MNRKLVAVLCGFLVGLGGITLLSTPVAAIDNGRPRGQNQAGRGGAGPNRGTAPSRGAAAANRGPKRGARRDSRPGRGGGLNRLNPAGGRRWAGRARGEGRTPGKGKGAADGRPDEFAWVQQILAEPDLKVTEAQRARLHAIHADARARSKAAAAGRAGALQDEVRRKVLAVLTPEQRDYLRQKERGQKKPKGDAPAKDKGRKAGGG